jgi:hypothetical protein
MGYINIIKHIRGEIRFPLLEVMSVGNKVVVRFDEDIYDNNEINYPATVMAIFTLDKGRIRQWEKVAYTKYFCRGEAANVVYSK